MVAAYMHACACTIVGCIHTEIQRDSDTTVVSRGQPLFSVLFVVAEKSPQIKTEKSVRANFFFGQTFQFDLENFCLH